MIATNQQRSRDFSNRLAWLSRDAHCEPKRWRETGSSGYRQEMAFR